MMLEDKLYDMFAYILYGDMMLLLLITPFLAEDTKGSYSWIKIRTCKFATGGIC